ncbi:MAG: polyprenyl synthetase family protein [Acidobacteria bacterium]|uniref:Polyprenyl synthetase family protein n=1 Tax=Candidatus Polarisedimenticola svalbardensis TaxID=2886004 RepID=A0A8J6XYF2_9BACT|nr:polyprenyl synthetase family protein [Candidatus Polarisedimenticola svalbardensis]
MNNLKSRLAPRRELIDRELDRLLTPSASPAATVEKAMHYAVMGGGKRLRPILALEACLACGGDDSAVLAPASALEMIHTYSLVHDDLPAMDDDDLRRGRATTHKVYGDAMAILAGDGLLTLAFRILGSQPAGDGFAVARCKAVALIAERAGVTGMVGGQVADLEAEGRPFDRERLEWIHRHKTGALLRASVELGAVLAGADETGLGALQRYGDGLGLAFQISDDILDCTATAADLGKTPGKDREAGKTTYPALLGLDGARAEADHQAEIAVAALSDLPGDTSILAALARYTVTRSS